MTPQGASLLALGAGLVLALAFALAGAVRLGKVGKELKERTDAYRSLPVLTFVHVASVKIERASARIATLSSLSYRLNSALANLAAARARAVAIATSPSAIWRLGELIVTGK